MQSYKLSEVPIRYYINFFTCEIQDCYGLLQTTAADDTKTNKNLLMVELVVV